MKITALTENTSQYGLPVEHGLSLYIQTDTHTILFDTGQTDLFARNARTLGLDLRAVDLATAAGCKPFSRSIKRRPSICTVSPSSRITTANDTTGWIPRFCKATA